MIPSAPLRAGRGMQGGGLHSSGFPGRSRAGRSRAPPTTPPETKGSAPAGREGPKTVASGRDPPQRLDGAIHKAMPFDRRVAPWRHRTRGAVREWGAYLTGLRSCSSHGNPGHQGKMWDRHAWPALPESSRPRDRLRRCGALGGLQPAAGQRRLRLRGGLGDGLAGGRRTQCAAPVRRPGRCTWSADWGAGCRMGEFANQARRFRGGSRRSTAGSRATSLGPVAIGWRLASS